jgi:CRISPR-associated endoribonuclease Cas6
MDLLSLVLTLTPLTPSEAPAWWGRAAQVLLLQTVAASSPELAAQLHDEQALHPYTATNLLRHTPNRQLDPALTYRLRFTALTPSLCAILAQAVQPGGLLAPGALVELDFRSFKVISAAASPAEAPWAASADYASLGSAHLLGSQPPARRVSLEFTSPTLFKTKERYFPLPTPELVFGSLLNRWNAFAPIAFPPELGRYVSECLAIGRFDLSSRSAPVMEAGARYGAVGRIAYTAVNYDRYWMSLVNTLAAYAIFTGAGKGTAMGLGQCCRIDEPSAGNHTENE